MTKLTAKNLTVAIGNKTICTHMNFVLEAGQIWGLIGINGSGKTTLLHTLANLHQAKSGYIYLNSKSIRNLSPKQIARKLAILLQLDEYFFPMTVMQAVLIGRHPHINSWRFENEEDINIALDALASMNLIQMKDKDIQYLSGGEIRRLAIATLLAQRADVYLLDEPTNHLDLNHQINVLNHFKWLAKEKNCAVLMALHDINLAARFCDNMIILLNDGQFKIGPTKALLTEKILTEIYQHEVISLPSDYGNYWILK